MIEFIFLCDRMWDKLSQSFFKLSNRSVSKLESAYLGKWVGQISC